MFDFTYHKPNSVSSTSDVEGAVIYLVPRLLAKSHPRPAQELDGNIAALPDDH